VEQGICKLCLLDKPLCMSHLIPRAAYDYCRPPGGNPLVTNADLITKAPGSSSIRFSVKDARTC